MTEAALLLIRKIHLNQMRVRVDFFALIIEPPDTFCTNEIHQHQFFSKQMKLFKSIFYFMAHYYFGDKFRFDDASTSFGFPHPLCTNEH